MTHDPLCPTQTMCKCKDQECWDCRDVVLCQCDLIAKVRADEDATGVVWGSDNGYLCLGPRVIRWPEGKHPEGLQALALLIPA